MSQINKLRGKSGGVLAVLLGLGSLDLTVLNVFVVPAMFTATDVSAARQTTQPATTVTHKRIVPAVSVATPAAEVRTTPQAEPLKPAEATVQPPVEVERARVVVIPFTTGNTKISRRMERAVGAWLGTLTQNDATIEVIGHADPPGPRTFNQRLSELRAEAVKELLLANGIAADRIEARGVGEDHASPEAHGRVVEIWIEGAP